MADKLSLASEMAALDTKDRGFYDSLDPDELKKFSLFLMMKYSSNVEGIAELQEWYLRAHNERVNRYFFQLGAHPKLQWLLCTTVSPNMGRQRHYWLKTPSRQNKIFKFLENLYPHMSDSELELMAEINTIDQIKQYARALGWDDKRIRDEL